MLVVVLPIQIPIWLSSSCTDFFTPRAYQSMHPCLHALTQIAGYGLMCVWPSVCGNTLHQPQPGLPSGSQVHKKAHAKRINKQPTLLQQWLYLSLCKGWPFFFCPSTISFVVLFCVSPADTFTNRVWIPSLGKLGPFDIQRSIIISKSFGAKKSASWLSEMTYEP